MSSQVHEVLEDVTRGVLHIKKLRPSLYRNEVRLPFRRDKLCGFESDKDNRCELLEPELVLGLDIFGALEEIHLLRFPGPLLISLL